MVFKDIILKKKNGISLTEEEIKYFADGAAKATVPDYQLSALLMAICFNGLNEEELGYLTKAMTESGDILDLSSIKGFKADKHSTGGVGDTTTLILAPLTASLGLPVVKMSGRGLGHTGGTLDKLEAIPSFNINISPEAAIEQVNKYGIVIMGQTENLAPADKALYALRDVTATVDSIPLITSSIMSKKLAAGSDGIVLDVKTGKGAFMKTLEDSIALANEMIKAGKAAGKKMTALITDMNEPLGNYIGNSLEVIEAIEVLKGNTEGRLKEVSIALGAEMLVMAGLANNSEEAKAMLIKNIENGKGIEKLRELIEIQGGNSNVIDDYSLFPQPKESIKVFAHNSGYVNSIDALETGNASLATGAGRQKKTDSIDPSAGLVMNVKVGDYVTKGNLIATIFSSSEALCKEAEAIVNKAIVIGEKPKERPLIYEVLK